MTKTRQQTTCAIARPVFVLFINEIVTDETKYLIFLEYGHCISTHENLSVFNPSESILYVVRRQNDVHPLSLPEVHPFGFAPAGHNLHSIVAMNGTFDNFATWNIAS